MGPAPRGRHGVFILLRRLRLPLIVLIVVYAVAVLGFTLVPGVDPQGAPWRMSFLHAFYFVSFLGTTIGLGEIPQPFSDAQRLWVTASLYATVVAWLYAIGALFAALQDPAFRRLLHESSVERRVRRLREPFVLLCGYDDAGYRVTRELTESGIRVVALDIERTHVDAADVDDHPMAVPALEGDASDPRALTLAGLTHRHCTAVLALTGDDAINTKVALSARLLNPALPVLVAARDHAWHPRMAAAGADHILNPFDTFAERVAMALRTPSLHVIYEALTTQSGTAMDAPPRLPRGRWVLCGFGLFGRTLRRQLTALKIACVVVDTRLDDSCDPHNSVCGDATDPAVLRRAGLDEADAVVAGTEVDIDNLAIVLAARSINRKAFVVARQTQRRNSAVFRASDADLVMFSGYVVAAEVLRHLRAPLLSVFLRRARDEGEAWAAELLQRLRDSVGAEILESWTLTLGRHDAGHTLRELMTRQDGSGELVRAVPLLLQRGQERVLLPDLDRALLPGDQVLTCGRALARQRMQRQVQALATPMSRSSGLSTPPVRAEARGG